MELEEGVGPSDVPLSMDMLSRDECLALLADHQLGRLAVVIDDQPVIFPVNYALEGDAIGVRTDPGLKFDAALLSKVAFEVDGVDAESHEGWSVVVLGSGREITDAIDAASVRMREAPLVPWAPGDKAQWIKIFSETITGRRLTRHDR
jgi:nitroimidazol reductase NimA-like FMN-containing flavoprotein (pyridoxamine 5'-phosphate oxidase superfamily)